MTAVARMFFTLSVFYALVGMALGLHMAISEDHGQMVTHAHIMLAGFVSSAIFGFFYHLVPQLNFTVIAKAHFWLHCVTSLVMLISLFELYGGNDAFEPGAAGGSAGYLLSVCLFAWISLSAIWGKARTEAPMRSAA
jgi:uncharacterized protein involved in response to NO